LEKKHKELKGMSGRCAKALKKIILASEQNEQQFRNMIDIKIDHYCGIHTKCEDSSSSVCKGLPKIVNEETLKDFMVRQLSNLLIVKV
jgi:hypothetical protein